MMTIDAVLEQAKELLEEDSFSAYVKIRELSLADGTWKGQDLTRDQRNSLAQHDLFLNRFPKT